MDIDYTVGEVELSYKPKFKKLHKVVSSEDAYKYLLPTYKEGTICYKEYFKVLFLNQASQILGYTLISLDECSSIECNNFLTCIVFQYKILPEVFSLSFSTSGIDK